MSSFLNEVQNKRLIKQGGQKAVYKAFHPDFGVVAFKTGSYSGKSNLERIKREVAFLHDINSPNYPRNYAFQIDKDNSKFYSMEEFITGNTLSNIKSKFASEITIIELLKKMLSALALLWNNSIVHRDLKPDNIMVRTNDEIVIIDLGIARFLDLESLTNTLNIRGPCTPIYAAPEQLTNQKRVIDQRCDFFSIGIITLELFLGHHPFDPKKVGNNNNILENILYGKYVKPIVSDICSQQFSDLVSRLLAIQPFQRFRNHRLFIEFLDSHWRQ